MLNPRIMPLKEPDYVQAYRLAALRPFVRQSGDDMRPPWYIGERSLFDYLLVYIASGEGVFTLQDTVFPVREGDLFWVPPDTPHSMRGSSRVMNCVYLHFDLLYDPVRSHWNAVIPGGLLDLSPWTERMHPLLCDAQINSWGGVLDYKGQKHDLLSLMREACREHRRCKGHSLRLGAMLLEIIDLLIRNTENADDSSYWNRQMDEAASYIRNNAASIKSLASLALRFKCSVSHFRRLFTARHGIAPHKMLQGCRIKAACELLAYGNANVSETAARCGFSSIYSFSRAFRRETGISPKNYRL